MENKIKEVLDATFISTSHNLIDEHGVIKRVLEDIVSMYKSENLRYTQEKQKHPEKKGLVLYSQKYKSSFITCEDFNKLEIPPQSDVKATFYKFNTENSFPANVCFAYSPEEEEDDYSPYEVEAYKVYKDSFVIKRNVYVQDEENGYYKYAGKETLNPDEYFVFVPDNKLLAVYDNGINPEYIRHKNYWDRLEDDKKPVDIDAAVESCRNLYESEKQVVREAIEKLNSYYGKDYNMFFININALENSLASKNIEAIQKELASLKDAESKNAVYEKMLSDKKEKKNELTESMLKEAKDRLVLIKRDNTEQLKKYIYQIIDFAMAGNETNTNVFLHYLFYCYDSIPDPVDKIAVTVCHVKNIIDIRKEKEKKDGYILSHPGYDKQTKYIEKIFAEYTNALFGRTDL